MIASVEGRLTARLRWVECGTLPFSAMVTRTSLHTRRSPTHRRNPTTMVCQRKSFSSTSIDSLLCTHLVDDEILNDHSEIIDNDSPNEVSPIDRRTLANQSIVSRNRRNIWNPMMMKNEMIRMTMVSRLGDLFLYTVIKHEGLERKRELFTLHFFQGHSFLLHTTCHWHWRCTRERVLCTELKSNCT